MVARGLEVRNLPRSLRGDQLQFREQERALDDRRAVRDAIKVLGGCLVVTDGDQVGRD